MATFEEVDPGSLNPITQKLVGAGEETIALTPTLLSSVAPSGIEPNDGNPGAPVAIDPLTLEVEAVVPEALPPELHPDADVPTVFVLMPPPSKDVPDGMAPLPEPPTPEQPRDAGLSPPGESSVEPSGIPTAPTADAVPGAPSGEVAPIAGLAVVSGAVWAKPALTLNSSNSDAMARAFNATSHCNVVFKVSGIISAV